MQNFLMTMRDERDALRKLDIVGNLTSNDKNEHNILSFPKYLNYEIGSSIPIQKFAYSNNIFVVPSFIIKTDMNERILVTNPTKECNQMIKRIKDSLFTFVEGLFSACKKIYPQTKIRSIVSHCNNSLGYTITYEDIAKYLYSIVGIGETVNHIIGYLKTMVDEVILPNMKDILFSIPSEDTWFIHPVDKVSKYFKGIVTNHDTDGDIIDYHLEKNKEIIHGDPNYLVM